MSGTMADMKEVLVFTVRSLVRDVDAPVRAL